MVSLTRRTFLHGAVGFTAALTGCSGLVGESGESTATASREEGDGGSAVGSVTDPDPLMLRVETDRPPVWLAESNGEPGGRPSASARPRLRNKIIVDDSTRADRIRLADSVDRERVASFFGATDFGTETVYVEMSEIEECFRLDLCEISWSATGISTDYTRRSRPYTERCEADEYVIAACLIRIPDAIDADDVNSYSSSIGTGACDRPRGRADGQASTDAVSASERDTRRETVMTVSGGGQ